ncbi:MAG TPA: choice-of-anchor M domain-containing protein, partial [Oceanipulchritudo sp.]|nr:choice-of-anchor M domain-containing protein [Oceanipulchritudo sp.]
VITVLGGYALTVIPDDSLFSFLGEAGDPLFLISASPLEGTPFLGFEAEDLLANVLSGPLEIGLHTADGPGEVFLYTVDAGGLPTLLWDSSSPAETYLSLSAGSHKHANIAFTQPGSYTLHLEVEAPLASGSEAHTEVALTFAVGGPEGFFSHFDQPFPDWLLDHSGKWFKTALWPLVWSPGEGWLFAYGPGGPAQYFYAYDRQGWILTNPESGLNAFDFTSADWTSWGD